MSRTETLSPGEARTRKRQRRYVIFMVIATVFGGIIGFVTGFFDQGDGNLFAGDWEDLSLPPAIAIGLAVALAAAFVAMPVWAFSQIDDYQREQNFIGFTGGMISVLAGFPIWAVMYAGGFFPPPHAFGIFAIGFVSMMLSFGYAKLRG